MILRIRPPTVRPTSWKRSRSPLFFRISKSEKKVSTASSNDTPCTASLSLSKSYSKSAGSNSFHLTTDPFYPDARWTRGLRTDSAGSNELQPRVTVYSPRSYVAYENGGRRHAPNAQ